MNMSVGGPTVGGYVPMNQGRLAQSATTSGTRVRITPDNYRQVLGPQSDVHLSPEKLKELYQKGYLDVVKTRQTMESNEGMFTIGMKAAMGLAAIFAPAGFQPPSRSLGAISIDPMYMEMLKDPNHKTGFGYTRVENESIQVLDSPSFPPRPERTDPPKATPYMQTFAPENPPQDSEVPESQWDPVAMAKAQVEKTTGSKPPPQELDTSGTFIHDSKIRRQQSEVLVGALQQGEKDGAFTVSDAHTNSNVLAGAKYNSKLSEDRADGLPPSWEPTGNSDSAHRIHLIKTYGYDVSGTTKDNHQLVKPSAETLAKLGLKPEDVKTPPVMPGGSEAAAEELFRHKRGERGPLQSDTDIVSPEEQKAKGLKLSPDQLATQAKIEAIAKKHKLNPTQKAELYKYAQSYVDHRSFDAHVTVKDVDAAENWLAKNKKLEGTKVYNDVSKAVETMKASQQSTDSTALASVTDKNIATLTAAVDGQPPKDIREQIGQVREQIKALEGKPEFADKLAEFKTKLSGLEAKANEAVKQNAVDNISALAKPNVKNYAQAVEHIDKQIAALGPDATLSKDVTLKIDGKDQVFKAGSKLSDLYSAAKAEAQRKPAAVVTGYNVAGTAAQIKSETAQLAQFGADIKAGKQVSPKSVQNFVSGLETKVAMMEKEKGDLEKIPENKRTPAQASRLAALEAAGVPALRAALNAQKTDPDIDKYNKLTRTEDIAAMTGGQGNGNFIEDVGASMDKFTKYIKGDGDKKVGVLGDGKIDVVEKATLEGFVNDTSRAMARYLKEKGVEGFANFDVDGAKPVDLKAKLSSVTPQMLAGKVPDADLDKVSLNVDRLKSAQAAINLFSETDASNKLYRNVEALNKKLDEFEAEGVVKTAFKGEMKELAASKPEVFLESFAKTYDLPGLPKLQASDFEKVNGVMRLKERPSGDIPKAAVAAYNGLLEKAQNGTLPFPPNVEFVDPAVLGGANGAYVTDATINQPDPTDPTKMLPPQKGPMILLSKDLLKPGNQALLQKVFSEEMFHHLEHDSDVQALEGGSDTHKANLHDAGVRVNQADEALRHLLTDAAAKENPPRDLKLFTPDGKIDWNVKCPPAGPNESPAITKARAAVADATLEHDALSLAGKPTEKKAKIDSINSRIKDLDEKLKADPSGPDAGKLKADLAQAHKELKAYSKDIDATGDEGRAGMKVLEAIRKGHTSPEYLEGVALAARKEIASVGGNLSRHETDTDQGTTKDRTIANTGFGSNITIPAGARMEFNSSPAAVGGADQGPTVQEFPMASGIGTSNPYASQTREMPADRPADTSSLTQGKAVGDVYSAKLGPQLQGQKPADAMDVNYTGKEEKSAPTKTKIAEMMMDAFPRGAQAVGQMLTKFFDEMRDKIVKAYADILGKEVFMAHGAIYGERGSHLHDSDAVAGRPDDYKSGQTTHMFRDSMNMRGKPNYAQHGGEHNESTLSRKDQEYRQRQTLLSAEELTAQDKKAKKSMKIR